MENINKVSDKDLEGVSGGSGVQYFVRYCVVRGDTLTKIANRFRAAEDQIIALNPCIHDEILRVGWVLLVPDNR